MSKAAGRGALRVQSMSQSTRLTQRSVEILTKTMVGPSVTNEVSVTAG
jgi:hypothetical protein